MLAHNVSYQKIIYGGLNVLNSPLSQMHMYVCNKYGPPTTSSMHLINEMSFSSTIKFHPHVIYSSIYLSRVWVFFSLISKSSFLP